MGKSSQKVVKGSQSIYSRLEDAESPLSLAGNGLRVVNVFVSGQILNW